MRLFLLIAQLALLMEVQVVVAQQQDNCGAELPELPTDIQTAKDTIIQLSTNNLDRWGDPEVQAQLNEQVAILGDWYNNNRPDNEVELTTGPWYSAWYEDTSIVPSFFGLAVDRRNTYQVVRDGFYHNIAKVDVAFITSSTNYLKGEFTIVDPKNSTSCGLPRRNAIRLEFTEASIQPFYWLPSDVPLTQIVDEVDSGERSKGFSFPGPIGTRGLLWNVFVDKELRVALGKDDSQTIQEAGLFVLIRQDFVNN